MKLFHNLNIKNFNFYFNQLANYCDNFMRTGTNGLNKVELEKKFDDIITLFRFIDDKDIFGKV